MPLSEIVKAIDAEISNRDSKNFGIKVGLELFGLLIKSGIITSAKFSVSGVGVFEEYLPAYRGHHFIWVDHQLDDLSFEVGKPLTG